MGTDFFLGGGFALLLALLGWGDQIRGIQERTRIHEKALLDACFSSWATVAQALRPTAHPAPDVQLRAVLKLIADGTIKKGVDVALLESFRELDRRRAQLERIYRARFGLVVLATFFMFLFGLYELLGLKPIEVEGSLRAEYAYSIVVLVVLACILILTVIVSGLEDEFRELLNSVEDQLRSSASKPKP